jgi:microcystin-dependent protein
VTPFDPNDPLGRNNLGGWDEQTLENWLKQRLPGMLPNFQAQIGYATGTLRGELTSDLTNTLRVPVGSTFFLPDDTAPDGYLSCDGTVYNIADYPDLGAMLGPHALAFGGDGVSTFGVPDLRGRVPVGLGTHLGADAIGNSENDPVADRTPVHTHLHVHSHGMEHNHGFTTDGTVAHQNAASSSHTHSQSGGGTTGTPSASVTLADSPHTHTGTTGNTSNGGVTGDLSGSGQEETSGSSMPYLILYGIIKT